VEKNLTLNGYIKKAKICSAFNWHKRIMQEYAKDIIGLDIEATLKISFYERHRLLN